MKRRVLVIEDDAWQAEMIVRQLAGECSVDVASDALAAFDCIDAAPPQAIILDMMLPGPNGVAFLHELRSHTNLADVPVIVCSTRTAQLATLRPYGVTAVLDKAAMQTDDILVAVRKVLV